MVRPDLYTILDFTFLLIVSSELLIIFWPTIVCFQRPHKSFRHYTRGPTHTQPNCLFAPHRHPRGSTWAYVAPPRARVAPRQLRVGLVPIKCFLQFFKAFKSEKLPEKSKIKSKKISKIHKLITSFLELLFDSNFLHWIKNLVYFNLCPWNINSLIHNLFALISASFRSSTIFFYSSLLNLKQKGMVNFQLFDLTKGQSSVKHIINPK